LQRKHTYSDGSPEIFISFQSLIQAAIQHTDTHVLLGLLEKVQFTTM